jgi:hypothetical protein
MEGSVFMRILSLLFCLILTASCSSLFKRRPSSTDIQKPKHYIMTLHGVRGTETAFGDFHQLIKMHLEKIDPNYEVVPLNIVYPKGEANFNAHASALAINKILDEKIKNLDPLDKISVLAYSMGGQVGMTWYYDSLKDEAHKKYPLQVSKFFSLGAAYWGSKEASLGVNIDNIFGQADLTTLAHNYIDDLNAKAHDTTFFGYTVWHKSTIVVSDKQIQWAQGLINFARDAVRNKFATFGATYDKDLLPYSKISFAELKNLAITSNEINENRISNIAYKNNTRWISLSSLIRCMETDLTAMTPGCQSFQNEYFKKLQLDVFGKKTFGLNRRESDNSVITPSANANFIYAVDADKNYEPGHSTFAANFHYSIPENQQRFILAEGLHATVIPAVDYDRATEVFGKLGESWGGLADDVALVYKKDCEVGATCTKHPSYKHILQEFADCEHSQCNQVEIDRILKPMFTSNDMMAQDALRAELHGFTLELNLRVPEGYDMTGISHKNIFNYLQMKFTDKKMNLISAPTGDYDVVLARTSELGSLIMHKPHFKDEEQLRVAMMGYVTAKAGRGYDAKFLERGTPVEFTINLPGLKPRKVQAIVRPYYTTYADLTMAK